MRIAVLHTRLAPYYVACLRELCVQGHKILIFVQPPDPNAPFDPEQYQGFDEIQDRSCLSNTAILSEVKLFQPDAVLVAGWADRGYMAVCQQLRKDLVVPVIAGCDTQWKGSLRQHVASWVAPWHLQRSVDVLWVSGERQKTFATALGYRGSHCWDGIYACDWPLFAEVATSRRTADDSWRMVDDPAFLFVGRYLDVKGINTLAEAYKIYKNQVEKPWRLICAGAGPLADMLTEAGAEDRGFVQPIDLPALMAEASAFVLPSRFEPWGVVLQEAAASGLPLICSDVCGAAVHLLRDQFNGHTFPAGNVDALVDDMVRISNMTATRYSEYANGSFELSKQYTPERWVETLCEGVRRLKAGR